MDTQIILYKITKYEYKYSMNPSEIYKTKIDYYTNLLGGASATAIGQLYDAVKDKIKESKDKKEMDITNNNKIFCEKIKDKNLSEKCSKKINELCTSLNSNNLTSKQTKVSFKKMKDKQYKKDFECTDNDLPIINKIKIEL